MKKFTTKLILDTEYQREDKMYPVRLRITCDGKRYYYSTKKEFTEKQWADMNSGDRKFKSDSLQLSAVEARAVEILEAMSEFDVTDFKNKMTNTKPAHSLEGAFLSYIFEHELDDRIGSAGNYRAAMNSFMAFRKDILLRDINVDFLKDYERWMKAHKKSKTTTGFYMRNLRAVINKAISDKQFSQEDYCFGKRRFKIPKGVKRKNPLSPDQLDAFMYYKPADILEERAQDLWMLSFYTGGRNPADLLHLKYESVTKDTITFEVRQKTKDSDDQPKPLIVEINSEIRRILDRWAQKRKNGDTYVIPELQPGMSATQIVYKRIDFGKRINASLKVIAGNLKIDKILLAQARHTAFNESNRAGSSLKEIQVMAGHSSESVTEGYLKSMGATVNKTVAALGQRKMKVAR